MSEKQLYAEKITRDDIAEAMKNFFDKGGKINKIEGLQQGTIDPFDTHDFSEEATTALDLGVIDHPLDP